MYFEGFYKVRIQHEHMSIYPISQENQAFKEPNGAFSLFCDRMLTDRLIARR